MDDQSKFVAKTPEEAESFLRTVFGVLPIGGLLNELIFDVGARKRQKRLNNFISKFSEGLSKMIDVEENQLLNEDFSDLFELVLSKSTKTRSDIKLKRFKSILLNQIKNPINYDMAIDITEIVSDLTDSQFLILESFYSHSKELIFFENAINDIRTSKAIIKRYEPKEDVLVFNLLDEFKYLTEMSKKVDSEKVFNNCEYLDDWFQEIVEHKSDIMDFCDALIKGVVVERDRIIKDQLRFDIHPDEKVIEEEWGNEGPSIETLISSFNSAKDYSMNDLRSKGLLFIPNDFRAQGDYNFANYRISDFGLELVKFTLEEYNKTK